MDIALATSADYPHLGPYDRGLMQALADLGFSAEPVVWNDPTERWAGARAVVIQSAWDSHLHPAAFQAWARQMERHGQLYNPAHIVRWNMHKGYLRELAARGIGVTPTAWVERGEAIDLSEVMDARGWQVAVVKPAVSAGAAHTHVVRRDEAAQAQALVDGLAADHDLMIQPYLEAFENEGERSYIFIDGHFSHAVQRPPTLQSATRGFDEPEVFKPADAELAFVASVVDVLEPGLLYARIDVATNNDGIVRLQEVELVEPCLFLSLDPAAASRLALAIAHRVAPAAR